MAALFLAATLHAQSLDQILTTFVKPPKSTRPSAPATITSDARMEELKAATVAELRAPNQAMLIRAVNKLIAAGITKIIAPDLPLTVRDYLDRLRAIAELGHPIYRYAILGPQPGFPAIPTRDYAYIDEPMLNRSRTSQGKLRTPAGDEFDTLVIPADDPNLRRRLTVLTILTSVPPPDDAPTRWHIGKYEFLYYFNETFKDKEFTVPTGELEEWDLASGYIHPVTDRKLVLEIGAAQLYRRTSDVSSHTRP